MVVSLFVGVEVEGCELWDEHHKTTLRERLPEVFNPAVVTQLGGTVWAGIREAQFAVSTGTRRIAKVSGKDELLRPRCVVRGDEAATNRRPEGFTWLPTRAGKIEVSEVESRDIHRASRFCGGRLWRAILRCVWPIHARKVGASTLGGGRFLRSRARRRASREQEERGGECCDSSRAVHQHAAIMTRAGRVFDPLIDVRGRCEP